MDTSPRWRIRPARAEDVPILVRMMVDETPWRELGYGSERCQALVAAYLGDVQVAVDPENVPVGFLRWNPQWFLGQPYLHLLAVAPAYRRQGVGRELVAWLEHKVFQERGCANLFLCVSSFNEAARAFYAELGYQDVGVLADFLQPGLDEVLLRKMSRPLLTPREEP